MQIARNGKIPSVVKAVNDTTDILEIQIMSTYRERIFHR